MDTTAIIALIDAEIFALQTARKALTAISTPGTQAKHRGRPAKSAASAPKRRTVSAEARARIAAAQKKRWAKQKRAAKKAV
jgi:hypothetical protein